MSSNPPNEGMFLVDQPAQAPAEATPTPEPAPQLAAAPEPAPAPDAGQSETMRDVPLGTLIFRAGLLAEEQLEDALQEGMRSGKRLGEVLLERGWLHERDLGRLLAGQKGLPFVDLTGVSPDPTAVPLIPEEKARMQNALAIAFEKGVPVVAVADPTNDLVMENLRRVLGCEPRLVVAAHGDLHRKIEEAYAPVADVPVPPQPLAAPETPAAAAPPPEPEVVAAPPPESLAVPPVPEPEAAASATEPLAAVSPEPVAVTPAPAPLATPPVIEPVRAVEPPAAAAELPPIQAQPLVQPVVEQQPVPAPSPAPAVETPPAAETPLLIQPLSVEPPLVPEAAPPPVEAVEPPAAEPVLAAAPVPAEAPAPVEPQLASEGAVNGSSGEESHHFVVLRLSEGEQLEIGTFGSTEEAQGFAQEVVRQIAAAEGEASWPFFMGRFLRPETIVSVDVVAEATGRWMGSSARAGRAGTDPQT